MKFVPYLPESRARQHARLLNVKRRARGFTLTEVLFATAALALVGMLFSATFPLAGKMEQSSRYRTIAVRVARREMEALRRLGYENLDNTNPGTMYTAAYPVIDAGTPVKQVCTSATPCTFSTLAADGVGAAATALPNGQADFWISEAKVAAPDTEQAYTVTPQTNLRRLTVRIRWTEARINRALTFTSLIANTKKTG